MEDECGHFDFYLLCSGKLYSMDLRVCYVSSSLCCALAFASCIDNDLLKLGLNFAGLNKNGPHRLIYSNA